MESFYYITPIQASAVVVRRTLYEKVSGFLPELVHTADREMWCRAVAEGGGVISKEVLADYRVFANNDTGRLQRLGKNVLDIEQLNKIMANRYANFNVNKAAKGVYKLARDQAEQFDSLDDTEAAEINWRIWHDRVTVEGRVRQGIRRLARQFGLR